PGLYSNRRTEVERLARRSTTGRLSAEQAFSELQRINKAKRPYPRFVSTLAWGGMAAFVTAVIGGGPLTALMSFLISALVDRIGPLLHQYSLPFFFQQGAGGLIATLAASTVDNTALLTSESTHLGAAAA